MKILFFLKKLRNRLYGWLVRQRAYKKWIRHNSPSFIGLSDELERLLKTNMNPPLFSIIVPVFNPRIEYLRSAIESVVGQVYPFWELCIVDDASTNPYVVQCLREYAKHDGRIKLQEKQENSHISSASNTALRMATGSYVVLMDHDDMLAVHALLRMAQAIQKTPEALLLYSDEDKINSRGRRTNPHFKPDWNPDLLLGQNYICHLTVLEAALVHKVGGFRLGLEGSQDHDLLLRCMPYLKSQNVVHIPDVLYHWRATEGSTAASAGEKPYTEVSGLKALEDYLRNYQPKASASVGWVANTYRISWPIPTPPPKVSLLIPTRDGVDILKSCIDGILTKTEYSNFEVLILDNQSSCPETLAYLKQIVEDPRITAHSWNNPFNFSAINNFGVNLASGEVIGLLNNDVEPIKSDWLTELVSQVCRPEIGCVGAKLHYPDGRLQHAGVILGIGGVAGHSHKYFPKNSPGYFGRLALVQNVSAVTGACLFVRKKIFELVGGLDEENLPVAFNDVDFCLKVRAAGYRNLWTPYAELYHHESISRGAEDTPEKQERFRKETQVMRQRWAKELECDPAYNPNLSLRREDFSIAP